MSILLEHLSMWNMLNWTEQVQIQKYKMHAYKTLKTAGVQSCWNIQLSSEKKKKKKPQSSSTLSTYT